MTTTSLASPTFLDLDLDDVGKKTTQTLAHADDGELYMEHGIQSVTSWNDGCLRDASFHTSQGFGLRAIQGEAYAYTHSPNMTKPSFDQAIKMIKNAPLEQGTHVQPLPPGPPHAPTAHEKKDDVHFKQQVDLLNQMDQFGRQLDSRISQVSLSLSLNHKKVCVIRPDAPPAEDERLMATLMTTFVLESGGRRESVSRRISNRHTLDDFLDPDVWQPFLRDLARAGNTALESIPAPAGEMPVVLGAGIPAILLHEAVGHGLEADFNRKGISVFSNRIGEQVTAPHLTIVDDGSLQGPLNRSHGTLRMDDEGTPTGRNVLIKDGILQGYMSDRLNAHLMGKRSTGNARRQSYAHPPCPRMTNTFLEPGNATLDDMIKPIKKGLYAVNFKGGQVDIVSGNFVFGTSEAYLIEDGKITAPVKGATLIGNGPRVMQNIDLVGHDFMIDEGVGFCGKSGQTAFVSVGQPSLRVTSMTVGGEASS